jgi:hypothetical protein
MAVTDEQLDQLKDFAEQLGRDGILPDPSDDEIVSAVLDMAETHGLRTEDEFNAVLSADDLPDPKDWEDIVKRWEKGADEFANADSIARKERRGEAGFC